MEVSLGPCGYWASHGVALAIGDAVVVEGYSEEDGTLAARSLTIVATGEAVVLRDDSGRPLWSGGRRNRGAGPGDAS